MTNQTADPPALPQRSRSARLAAGAVPVVAGGLQTTSEVLDRANDRGVSGVAWIADHPGTAGLITVVDLVAIPFLIGVPVVWTVLARRRSPRFAWSGGVLALIGMAGFGAFIGTGEVAQYVLATGGVDPTAIDHAYATAAGPPVTVLFTMFFGGSGLGILLLLIGLWRARAVPRGAVLLIGAFLVVDFGPLAGVVPFPVHALFLAGAAWMAVALLGAGRPAAAVPADPISAH
jgi:hypothetical protein